MYDSIKIISLFGKDSYAKKFPGLPLIHEEDFFLECRCYDVCLPVAAAQPESLNIFEETVLRLMGLFGKSVAEISECSCLKKDFVQAVCLTLYRRGFVNENNVLTDAGKDYLNNTEQAVNVDEKAIRVLTLPDTGLLLAPILQDFKSEYDGFFDGKKLIMTVGDIGNAEPRKGSFTIVPKENILNRPVYVHDVKKIIREYNRTTNRKIRLADGYAISISQRGSRVFLHVKCALQRGLVEHPIVSDGTAMISGALVQYLMENHGDYVESLFERATTFKTETASQKTSSHDEYYHVRENLNALEDFLPETDPDTMRINLERKKDNFNRLNAAVEHALNYYLLKYPVSEEREKILYAQTPAENCRTLLSFAHKLNLTVGKNTALLSHLNRMSFEQYRQSGVPSLNFVLPLAIVSGAENGGTPFAAAVQKIPKLFALFNALYRGKSLRHGSEEEQILPTDYSSVARDVKKFIGLLLPDYQQNDAQGKSSARGDDTSQERLNAVVALKKILGSKIYYEAGDNLRNDLIRLSPYYRGDKMPPPMDFVNYLYRCLENYIRGKANNFSVRTKNLAAALPELERLTGAALPKSLKSVSQEMFKRAAGGQNASLGAYTLVLISALPKELLTDKDRVKKFLDDTGEIVALRQHANNTELNLVLTAEKLGRLRDNAFDAIKFLEEF